MRRVVSLLISLMLVLSLLTGCGAETSATRVALYGESEHWQASVIAVSTKTFTKAGDGKLTYQGNYREEARISWRGQDRGSVGPVHYEYVRKPGGSSAGDVKLSPLGYAEWGGSGSGVLFDVQDPYAMLKVQWDGHEEVLELRPGQVVPGGL